MNGSLFLSATAKYSWLRRDSWLRQGLHSLCQKPVWLKAALGLWIVPAALSASPAVGAERIYVSYGALERSISISALEEYAETGVIGEDLAVYARYATGEQLAQLREALRTSAEISPVAVSQFLYTRQGEILLERLGQVVQSESRQPGFYAIRAALILAAADPEGLTLLNVLRYFPTNAIRIDLIRSLQIAEDVERLINQTYAAIAIIEQQAEVEAANEPPLSGVGSPNLEERGPGTWQKETVFLSDFVRNRTYPVDVYLPQSTGSSQAAPVIVLSHGLGTDRTTFAYLADHLASYGFAVAVPEHPGSNAEQLQALANGVANEVAEPNEFINRPLDIKYLLDELERLSNSNPTLQGRLNLQQVGVLGQSFGGYTALALAGAPINFERLATDCASQYTSLNLSLLLQCRAEDITEPDQNLSDERVKAVIAVNPISSIVLGPASLSQIDVPVMIVTGNADTVAPALSEQIQPFTSLTSAERYLLLIRGSTHFSTIASSTTGSEVVPLPPQAIGPAPALARRYLAAMSVAFFQAHVADNPQYDRYLTASYADLLAQEPLHLSLVQFLTADQLERAIANPRRRTRTSAPTPEPPESTPEPSTIPSTVSPGFEQSPATDAPEE